MWFIKTGMIFLICLFATIGKGADEKKQVENAINYLSELVGQKYQLSTTGYEVAMAKDSTRLTSKRAQEYITKAKEIYPTETLKNLGILQSTYINRLPETGQLSDPHHFTGNQLSAALLRVREKNFANCEMQAFEVAIHLYALGFKRFAIYSNKGLSHNYLIIGPTNLFPKGAVVDPWSGFGIRELDLQARIKYKQFGENIMIVQNMMDWLPKNASIFANKAWIKDIRLKFFPWENSTPLQTILIPVGERK